MQEQFGPKLDLEIHTVNSPAAATYSLKGSTNVFVNEEWVGLDIATDKEKMQEYLSNF